MKRTLCWLGLTGLVCSYSASPALAESWCAYPVWAHEWGVQVFDGNGLLDHAIPSVPTDYSWWEGGDCVMMRDPAVPESAARGHRLYSGEVNAILDVWGDGFFEQEGTTIVYREDIGYLDAMMPLSIYTDMFHYTEIRRLGLAVVQDVALP